MCSHLMQESGQCIALKRIRFHQEMSPKTKQRWEMECRIMQKLGHENVIKAFPVPPALDVRDSDMPLLAMEYCEGGDLRKVRLCMCVYVSSRRGACVDVHICVILLTSCVAPHMLVHVNRVSVDRSYNYMYM